MKIKVTKPIFTYKDLIEYFPKFYPLFDESNNILFLNKTISVVLYTNIKNVSKEYDLSIKIDDDIDICAKEIDKNKKEYHFHFSKVILLNDDFIKYIKLYKKRCNNINKMKYNHPNIKYGQFYYNDLNKGFIAYGVGRENNLIVPYLTEKYFIDAILPKLFDKRNRRTGVAELSFDHDCFDIVLPRANVKNLTIKLDERIYSAFITYTNCYDYVKSYTIEIVLIDSIDNNHYVIKFDQIFFDKATKLKFTDEDKKDLNDLKKDLLLNIPIENKIIKNEKEININKKNSEITTRTTVILPTNNKNNKSKKKESNKELKCPHCENSSYYRRGKIIVCDVEYQKFSCNHCGKMFKISLEDLKGINYKKRQ